MKRAFAAFVLLIGLGAAAPPKPFRDCADCGAMVAIPPGRFLMGADGGEPERYEGPVRPVTIARRFAVAVDPVTNAQFAAFVTATGHRAATDCVLAKDRSYVMVKGADWRDPGYGRPPRADEPAVCLDWRDATAYAAWLARKTGKPYRLLTEAEWEYVARAGTSTRFPWGDDAKGACRATNLLDASAPADAVATGTALPCRDGFPTIAPVGRFEPNRFGVRDMIGNVWTWVQDCYAMPYPAAPADGAAQEKDGCDRRSVRGASWATNVTRARPTFRGRDPVDRVSQLFGVRVARDLP